MIKVQILYFEGCPTYMAAEQTVREALAEEGIETEVVMRNGIATFRPDEPVQKIAKRMRERGASAVLVTTSDGRLVGLLERLAAEQM